jgi:crotonobetainyl-CoA:carnitine CoA-transferase CaiB-like acyl-CoA transferase
MERPDGRGSVTVPGAPFLAPASPFRFERRPPLLGEHTQEVLGELLGGAAG